MLMVSNQYIWLFLGNLINLSPFRRTFELGQFTTTAGKIIIVNNVKCGKYKVIRSDNQIKFHKVNGIL
jgi:hypothetical protein